jgi:hypothetical protein
MLYKLATDKRKSKLPHNIWITHERKSFYIFTLLAYHFCSINPDLSILLPHAVLRINGKTDDLPANSDYYVFDDISYSGSQLSVLTNFMIKSQKDGSLGSGINTFNYCLCYVTNKVINVFKDLKTADLKCSLNYSIVLKSLSESIGQVKSAIVRLLFNPSSPYGDVIVYCDHKMADATSTYMLTLQYGIIPPNLINFGMLESFFVLRGEESLF